MIYCIKLFSGRQIRKFFRARHFIQPDYITAMIIRIYRLNFTLTEKLN